MASSAGKRTTNSEIRGDYLSTSMDVDNHPIEYSSFNLPPAFMQLISNMFKEQFEKQNTYLTKKINESKDEVINSLKSQVNQIATEVEELKTRMDENEQKNHITHQKVEGLEPAYLTICSLKNSVTELQTKLSVIANNAVSCDVRIHGIPIENNEDLADIA